MNDDMTEAQGFRNFAAGLAVGLTCLASGMGIAKYTAGYMKLHYAKQERRPSENNTDGGLTDGLISSDFSKPLIVGWRFLCVLVFLEAIGLYGLIVALLLSSNQK
eukprot:Sro75_g041370.2  (105) ;mRNA; r:96136-96450